MKIEEKVYLKVAIIEPVGGHGGMDYYDYGLAYGLGANDVKVLLFTCDETQKRIYNNVESIFLFKNLWNTSLPKKSVKYVLGHLNAFRILKKNKIKLAHFHFYFFRGIDLFILILSKLYKFQAIVTVHDVNSFHNKSNSFIEKSCYKLIDGIIVHNNSSFKTLKSKISTSKQIAIIPHGNYLPFIVPENSNKYENAWFSLLFFGQVKEVKGLDLLIQALSIVIKNGNTNIRLVIKGKAYKNDLSKYINLIEKLNIASHVEYDFRYIPDDEISKVYNAADLIVLPYREIYQSGVLLLSMSYGKPVLCSDLEPFKEVIEDGKSGLLFRSDDATDLANKIEYSFKHRDKLREISEEASKIIMENFDWRVIGSKTKIFYETVVNK